LQAEGRALVEDAAIRLLPDESEPAGLQLARDPLETLLGACEVGAAEVTRSRRRAIRRIRDSDAFFEQLELLGWVVEPGCEVRRVQQPPEVVARIREVRVGRRRDAAGIDPDEDDIEARRQDVRDVARSRGRYAASASSAARRSSRSSRRLRMSSPETVGE
jgi:hypothetical protein